MPSNVGVIKTTLQLGSILRCNQSLNLETLLSSSCRRKILKILKKTSSTHVMELVCQVDSTYNQVNCSLKILQEEGIIVDEYLGRMRVVKLNKASPKTKRLLEALSILEDTEE